VENDPDLTSQPDRLEEREYERDVPVNAEVVTAATTTATTTADMTATTIVAAPVVEAAVVPEAPTQPNETLVPPAPRRPPRSTARLVMICVTMLTLVAALGLLLRRVSVGPKAITPVSVASQTPAAVTPAEPPADTVVAPLSQVAFTPAPPAIGADLKSYESELTEALRPVINVTYTGIVENPQPWSSHLFGISDMPASLSAPVDETGQALCMVSQINLADLPALPAAQGNGSTLSGLPRTGVLQFWLALESPGSAGWTGGPTFAETADNPRQKITFISAADVASAPAKRLPMNPKCSSRPPAKGPAVALGMSFANAWNQPETTDNRFDSSFPLLAGTLRSNSTEFYRANGAISSLLGPTPVAQIGGFNRLVNQDPRVVGASFAEDDRVGVATDVYEVLFEVHPSADENDRWNVGFGNEGSGGWWADPKEVAKLAEATGVTGGRSGIVKSAFWWDGQVASAAADGQPS
jgi:Domain of unknown function (DUF1963)